MLFPFPLEDECHWTKMTLTRSRTRVFTCLVPVLIPIVDECLRAEATLVWLLARMHSNVTREAVLLGECHGT